MTTNTKTVAFVNLKGGVGKTTSAIGTAEALARLGHTVTVRDADPSGAATLWAHKALSAGRPLPFGVEVVNRFTVAAPAEEEWVLIDTPPLQTDLVEAAVDAADVLLQCLFDRFGSVFPQCGLMVFPGVVIVSR